MDLIKVIGYFFGGISSGLMILIILKSFIAHDIITSIIGLVILIFLLIAISKITKNRKQ